MKFTLNAGPKAIDLHLIGVYSAKKLSLAHLPKNLQDGFAKIKSSKLFKAELGETFAFTNAEGEQVLLIGLGDQEKLSVEQLRRQMGSLLPVVKKHSSMAIYLDHFCQTHGLDKVVPAVMEGLKLASYKFDKYLSKKNDVELKNIYLITSSKLKGVKEIIENTDTVIESMFFARDLVNEVPNVLNAPEFANILKKDAAKLKGVKVSILNKAQIQKEKMGLLLAVNAGSVIEPRVVHLTYTPAKQAKNAKHIALIGKGLTFDTGGYSLKPGESMMNMKNDMGGAATVYAAFRAAVQMNPEKKISCFIGMTDNMIGPTATMPDTIVTARSGKTVEILNTDAEGRLVLADVIDYACDFKPEVMIDAATLTGAILIALGGEVAGMMSNSDCLSADLLQSAKEKDEYLWRLPIIEEFSKEMKSPIADLKNMGSTRFGGSSKAAAFLKEFVREGVEWAHLDIAGVASEQSYLPYCPGKGASALMVRTLVDYLIK